MSRFSPESWRLEIGRRSVDVSCRARGASAWQLRASTAVDFDNASAAASAAPADQAAVLEAVRVLVESHVPRRTAVAMVIRDECARYAVVDPPVNARRPDELRFAAAARMKALFGDVSADWIVDADWSATRRFLACAVPAAMLRMARRCLADAGRRQGSMSTEFVAAWNAQCARTPVADAWVAHSGRETVLIAACADSRISEISMSRFGAAATVGDAMAEARRCALRWGRAAPETVYLLGTGFPNAVAHQDAGVVDLSSSATRLVSTGAAAVRGVGA